MAPRALMLVSDFADETLRDDVARGVRPCPEYLQLERQHGVELLDWSRLPAPIRHRSWRSSLLHAGLAAVRAREFDVVFSDGEHVGIPLAIALQALQIRTPHLMLGHHVTTAAKRRLFRLRLVRSRIDRIVLHSQHQIALTKQELNLDPHRLKLVPYFADSAFWAPRAAAEEPVIVSAGREHRDYATLAAAISGQPLEVVVAVGSPFSPRARWRPPARWPSNFALRPNLDRLKLRELYARASVIAVPLLRTDFQAGVTTVLEAMSMGKPVVVSATPSQIDIVEDGVTGVLVPPEDPHAMANAIAALMSDRARRNRIGLGARRAIEGKFSLDKYSAALAAHIEELAHDSRTSVRARRDRALDESGDPIA